MACIARGQTGVVIGVSARRVAKVFPARVAAAAGREFSALSVARAAGLPVPAPVRLKRWRGGAAVVMERVPGLTMHDHFLSRRLGGLRLLAALRTMARIHAGINSHAAPGLAPQRAVIARAVRAARLDAEVTAAALAPLDDDCPRRLCHGDMHVSNILWSDGRPVVIDWETGGAGWPAYDAARAVVLLLFGASPHDAGRLIAATAYMHWYCGFSGLSPQQVRRWLPTAGAARLGAGTDQTRRAGLTTFVVSLVDGVTSSRKGRQTIGLTPFIGSE